MSKKKKLIYEKILTETAKFLADLEPVRTDWAYSEFRSYEVSAAAVGATGGVLSVRKGDKKQLNFKCGNVDGGAVINPVPFDINFPMPELPDTGIIFKKPSLKKLTAGSFRGPYFVYTIPASGGAAGRYTFFHLGAKFMPSGFQLAADIVIKTLNYSEILLVTYSEILLVTTEMGDGLPDAEVSMSLGISI